MFQPVSPLLGPDAMLKVTLAPDTGFPAVSNTVTVRIWLVPMGFIADRGARDMTLTQVLDTVFEVTLAFCSFKKLAAIVSVPGEPFDV